MKPLLIASYSLRRFYRDRTALFFTVALPVVIILLIGTATSQFAETTYPVGIVVEDPAPLSSELRSELEGSPSINVEAFDSRESLGRAVRRGAVAAGVVVPFGYDQSLGAGRGAQVEILIDQRSRPPVAVRAAVAEAASSQGATIQAAAFTTEQAGGSFPANLATARELQGQFAEVAVGIDVETVGRQTASASLDPGIGYQTPSMLILFVFITSMAGAALLIQSRQLGVTERMFGTPTSVRSILLGEGLSRFAIAGAQALIIFVFGLLVFGVEWGSPAGALAVISLFVLVGTSFGMLAGTIFSTPEMAGSVGPPLGIAMGMLGGCMWPLEIVPDAMRIAGHAFPHAWAMDAWIELIGAGGGIGDILTELAVLAGFVAVVLPLATWRLRRALSG